MVKAARSLALEINPDAIQPPRGIVPATIRLHHRRWSGAHTETFECFQTGTILTVHFLLDPDMPKCPTLDQFRLLLGVVGEWMGLTQWGGWQAGKKNTFGYGVFRVESAESVNYKNYELQP